jgi:G:T-mismatch repair DNA endonuclease (very short patch repair protein)
LPKRNREFWTKKFGANKKRDRIAVSRLREMNFAVVTIWECEVVRIAALAGRLSRVFVEHASKGLERHVPTAHR